LAARFAVASLATSFLFWLVLGAASGALFQRSV
jgi:predicted cobalt transporter CbtA